MLLQTKELDLTLSISVTTRARRSSEVDGIHYRFITKKQFEQLRDGGDLLEWAEVHGNFYGTPRAPAEQSLRQGRDVLFDIDYQGTRQIKEKSGRRCRHDLYPAAVDAGIASRLERRAEDRPDVIDKRLNEARNEIRRWTDYDYVLVNDDLQSTFAGLRAILAAEHRRTARARRGSPLFVERLLGET
jgi:guanylate kinase